MKFPIGIEGEMLARGISGGQVQGQQGGGQREEANPEW